ncbi:BRD4-interacting chromatin-remodeling complex-associated protein-like isoform X1 [Pimephales promelas]|uniref:BRD4-interacting chromatin-remodeling complex-associated protein-like isoform X1 n=2 Tax=Pimephales promelas TaxID=90988 RepID=UPI001955E90D|nr:BRD4-interacting chromatin-remodeling complex-associated protein-like isoform X1 [Pimephales promelas]KAG1955122.1 BRD4-interacting chromatin-remodeling complex-associated protein-like [Pimephales promelas]
MLPSAGAALLHRPVQRWRGNPVDTALLFHDGVMDDEDDRRLLDFLGDVQALNEYLHGSNSKSIGEDDVTNAAFGSASSFFTSDTSGSNEELKDGHNHLGEFGEAGGAELQLSSSLPFIEDDLDGGTSPDLSGEDQPFDILQKSLLEADITEQTLAQEALLDSQPSLIPTATAFPQQLVSGGFGGVSGPGVVAPLAQPQAFIQQVPQLPLPNGPSGHIQVVGSFSGSASSMMTINSLEQPQILLRQSGNVVTNNSGQGTMFTPSAAGQVSMSFNKGTIPLQNIIIQRGPTQQALVRPIQPKPLQAGGQTVYNISNIGLQPSTNTAANLVSGPYTTTGSPQSAQQVKVVNPASSIVMHSPLGQQVQPQSQSNLPQGQFLLPSSISLTPGTTVHSFQTVNGQVLQTNTQVGEPGSISTTTYSILTNQNTTVQLIAGQNFSAGGQLIVNQGLVSGGQIGQASPTPVATTKVWNASASPSPSPLQTSQSHLTMVSSGVQGPQVCQQLSVSPGQHLQHLMPVGQNAPTTSGVPEFQVSLNQNTTTATQRGQTQLVNLLGTKAVKTLTPASQELPLTPKRPATQQLTRGGMVLQQLRQDHCRVMSSERTPFTSLNDGIYRLLPYHVFQGSPPQDEDFAKIDEEFEAVATQVLNRTQAMVNKYRRLLMVEAERSSPSSEMVMIDRTFNQEERGNLTQDKRMILVDPDGFLEDFCCGRKLRIPSPEVLTPVTNEGNPSTMETSPRHSISLTVKDGQGMNSHTEPAYRTESQQQGMEEHRRTPIKCILDLKKKTSSTVMSSNSQHAHYPTSPSQSKHSSAQGYPSSLGRGHEEQLPSDQNHTSLADTDSVLEAAVNSILEC